MQAPYWTINPLDMIEALSKAGWVFKDTLAYKRYGELFIKLDTTRPPIIISWKADASTKQPYEEYQQGKDAKLDAAIYKVVSDLSKILYTIPGVNKDEPLPKLVKPEVKTEVRPEVRPDAIPEVKASVKARQSDSFKDMVERGETKAAIMAYFSLSEREYERILASLKEIQARPKKEPRPSRQGRSVA